MKTSCEVDGQNESRFRFHFIFQHGEICGQMVTDWNFSNCERFLHTVVTTSSCHRLLLYKQVGPNESFLKLDLPQKYSRNIHSIVRATLLDLFVHQGLEVITHRVLALISLFGNNTLFVKQRRHLCSYPQDGNHLKVNNTPNVVNM